MADSGLVADLRDGRVSHVSIFVRQIEIFSMARLYDCAAVGHRRHYRIDSLDTEGAASGENDRDVVGNLPGRSPKGEFLTGVCIFLSKSYLGLNGNLAGIPRHGNRIAEPARWYIPVPQSFHQCGRKPP